MAEELLDGGADVMVEKPITATLAEADRLVALARAKGRVLQVGHIERFNPAVAAVRPLVTDVKFIEAHRLGVFVPRALDVDVVLDLLVHDLDIALDLVGRPVDGDPGGRRPDPDARRSTSPRSASRSRADAWRT